MNVRVMFLTGEGDFGNGIVLNSPSIQAVIDKVEAEGGVVFHSEEVSDAELAEIRARNAEAE